MARRHLAVEQSIATAWSTALCTTPSLPTIALVALALSTVLVVAVVASARALLDVPHDVLFA